MNTAMVTPAIRDANAADARNIMQLVGEIWGERQADGPITSGMLTALIRTGSAVQIAIDDETIVGACIGFPTAGRPRTLYSHLTAVRPCAQGTGVGRALKNAQRTWAYRHDLVCVEWVFDPLVRRNAVFNLTKLGATPTTYTRDFYGPMSDAVNRGQGSDRLHVCWPTHPPVDPTPSDSFCTPAVGLPLLLGPDAAGRPTAKASATAGRIAIPPDIERLRATQPDLARQWRSVLRTTLKRRRILGLMTSGEYVVTARF